LAGLTILGDTSLELTNASGNDENGTVRLGGSSDHVLDEVTVTRSIDDSHIISRSFELPERNVDGDATFTLGLELVEHPGIFEGALAKFGSFLQSAVSICVTMGYDFAKWRYGDGCNCFGGLDRRRMPPAAL